MGLPLQGAFPPHFSAGMRQGGLPTRGLATGLWLVLLLYASLLPARRQETVWIFGVPALLHELLLVVLVLVLAFLLALEGRRAPPETGRLPVVFSALFGYAWLSLLGWSAATGEDSAAMTWTLVLASAAMWGGYLVVRFQRRRLEGFLASLTLCVGFIAVVYTAQSFFNLGLRSEANAAPDLLFGIDRVRGPLFGASYGGALLIPALAYAIQERAAGRHRLRNGVLAAALLVACIATGSRAALLGLLVLFALNAWLLPTMKQRLAFGGTVLTIGLVATALLVNRISTERLRTLEDEFRALTYQTSYLAVARATPFEKLRGQGYASYWRWYLTDARGEGSNLFADYIMRRPAGLTLYHPHSTLLVFVVELGLPGLVAVAWLLGVLWRTGGRAARRHLPVALFAGLAGSAASLLTDLLLFKAPFPSLVWWTYLFGALALADGAFSSEVKASAHSSPG